MNEIAALFYSIGEPYAAGLFEEPDKDYFYRYCLAYSRYWEALPPAKYDKGDRLYPTGNKVFTLDLAVEPQYCTTHSINWKKLKEKSPEAYEHMRAFNETYVGQVFSILTVFIKIIGIIFLIHIGILILQFAIAGGFAKKNPFKLLWTMMPAYFTALGTQSSAATIPVTLEQTRKNGVSEEVAGFAIPLCATIHMSGSTLKIVACALALMIMQGMPYDFGMFFGFICMLGITMVAAPGVPGGAIMASLGLLQSMLGFDQEAQALMIALYIAMDSFGTACNVTGDGAIALIVDRITGRNFPTSSKK